MDIVTIEKQFFTIEMQLGKELLGSDIVSASWNSITHLEKLSNGNGKCWKREKSSNSKGTKVSLTCWEKQEKAKTFTYQITIFPVKSTLEYSSIKIGIKIPGGRYDGRSFSANFLALLLREISMGNKISGIEFLEEIWKDCKPQVEEIKSTILAAAA